MLDLQNALLHLSTTADSPYTDEADRVLAVQSVFDAAKGASQDELNGSLPRLADLIFMLEDDFMATMIAVAAGALVEFGGDPVLAFDVVLDRAEKIAEKADAFGQKCQASGVFDLDDVAAGMQSLAEKFPQEAQSWQLFDRMYLPVVAMMSRSKNARSQVRKRDRLWNLVHGMSDVHDGAGWLAKLFAVLDDEEILVLHPDEKRGYRIRISGVADNFQLHLLLADALIGDPAAGWLAGKSPDPRVVAAMRDQILESDLIAEGVFNLLQYTALESDGSLPAEDSAHWIWNEGLPADIESFEGTRVILLQSPTYQRTWNANRLFSGMVGELTVLEQLTQAETESLLKRIAVANQT